MINKKIFLFYFVFVFTNIFCFGQEENDFFEFYAQYRVVKSHDHSPLLVYSIKDPSLLIEIGTMNDEEGRKIMYEREKILSKKIADILKSFNKDRPNWN
jgi:hypothetical protein